MGVEGVVWGGRWFYVLRGGGNLTVTAASLKRNEKNRVNRVRSKSSVAMFGYGEADLVKVFELTGKP
jgi:hypothetical protein